MNYVIVGGSAAGIAAAQALRTRDANCGVSLIVNESFPYLRPRIVTLLGGADPNKLVYKKPDFFAERSIELISDEAVGLDAHSRVLTLSGGKKLPYDKLCLSMGASAFKPPIPGIDKGGVFTLTTMGDALSLSEFVDALPARPSVVVMGAGLIGLEAAEALAHKAHVTIVELSDRPLSAILPFGNDLVRESYEALGVKFIFSDSISEILGEGSVSGVRTGGGLALSASALVVTAGVRPRVLFAKEAGLKCGRGVLVSNAMLTSDENIYACGDVAELRDTPPGPSLWTRAMAQGKVAGENMAGGNAVFTETPPMNALTLGPVQVFTLGNAKGGKIITWRGENEARSASLENGVLIGASRVGTVLTPGKLTKAFPLGEPFSMERLGEDIG